MKTTNASTPLPLDRQEPISKRWSCNLTHHALTVRLVTLSALLILLFTSALSSSSAVAQATTSTANGIESRLRALVSANGAIYGEDPGMQPPLPFALQNVTFAGNGVVNATFSRITSHLKFPIVGQIIDRQIEFTMDAAYREEWRNPAQPPLFLLAPDNSALTTGNKLLVIPLDAAANRALGEKQRRMVQPWSVPAEASAYILAQGSLWNLNTKQKVIDAWLPNFGGVRPVKDAPGLFWKTIEDWGVSAPAGALTAYGIGTIRPRGREYSPSFLHDGSGWIAADAVRVVGLENGDFWRGEFDWTSGEIKNRQPVTSIGVFAGAKPIAWLGNRFYIERPQGGAKPIVRIDLRSGDIVEMEKPLSFGGVRGSFPMRASPSGRYLAQDDPEGSIVVYDLVNESETRFDAKHVATFFGRRQDTLDAPRTWTTDRFLLGAYGWFDIQTGKRQLIVELAHGKGYESLSLEPLVMLPGGNFIDTVLVEQPMPPEQAIEDRYRIDLRSGAMIALPDYRAFALAAMYPAWIDETRYLYVRNHGSLDEVGVWIYNIQTKAQQRLTPLLPDSQAHNTARIYSAEGSHRRATSPFLILPERNQVVFVALRGEQRDLILVNLSDGKIDVLESNTTAQQLARIDARPMDLNVADKWGDPWDPARFVATDPR